MRIAVAAADIPDPEGTAAGRDLWAWCDALRGLGHQVEVWIWSKSPLSSADRVPEWATYDPHPVPASLGAHLRALVAPRMEAARGGWEPGPDAVAVADHVPSVGAVLGHPRSVATLHFRALADALAVRRLRLPDLQTARAERRAGRECRLVLCYSDRVARGIRRPARVVPMTYPVPAAPLAPVEEPVAALIADWGWLPNRVTLARLLEMWPSVRAAVPAARLLLAGRQLPSGEIGSVAGVEVIGPVAQAVEVLGRAALVAFPCPGSSGPKGKTLEALAHGLPVVTTPAGVEGIDLPPEAMTMAVPVSGYVDRLVELLRDPPRRARLGGLGRTVVASDHAPVVAARARLDAFREVFGVE